MTACAVLWFFLRPYISVQSQDLAVIPSFSHLAKHCADTPPIGSSEFYLRQKSLARILHSVNASAYIAEPGASAQFFANISSSRWHLSERPLLLIVSPQIVHDEVEAKISILTPSFEATRAKLLLIPSASDITFAEWPEDVNPYEVAISTIPSFAEGQDTIFVDSNIRHFIVDGLDEAAPKSKILSAPIEIRYLRERKSPAEIDLLKCVNEARLFCHSSVGACSLLTGYRCCCKPGNRPNRI